MPIYEFYCPDNHKIYSFFARTLAQGRVIPPCPDNPKFKLERLLSRFAVRSGGSKPEPAAPSAHGQPTDARMEQVMQQMEREFSSLGDSDNPDPRLLGRMMRRMTEVTGEKMPGQMEEMIRRLEAGEDPEKLEEQFNEAFDEDETGDAPAAEVGGSAGLKLKTKSKPNPTRDPKLYDYP
jgi:hypothetical protein